MAKGIYVGGPKPVWEMVWITPSNINQYFTVSNSTAYTFVGSDNVYTANNLGVNSSTAHMKLTLKQDVGGLQCAYMYTTEQNFDKFYILKNGTTVVNGVSGSLSEPGIFNSDGAMKAGEYIEFKYTKDVSVNATNETCYFQALAITIRGEDDTTNGVARKVDAGYVGVEGVARTLTRGYAGVEGVARECFGDKTLKWNKYNCNRNLDYYVEASGHPIGTQKNIERYAERLFRIDTAYKDNFNVALHGDSFVGNSYSFYNWGYSIEMAITDFTSQDTLSTIQQKCVGKYLCFYNHEVLRIDSISEYFTTGGTVNYFGTIVGTATIVAQADPVYSYSKGSTDYGIIETPIGELPKEGTLIEGSLQEGYCILFSSSDFNYYYYSLKQSDKITWNKYNCATSVSSITLDYSPWETASSQTYGYNGIYPSMSNSYIASETQFRLINQIYPDGVNYKSTTPEQTIRSDHTGKYILYSYGSYAVIFRITAVTGVTYYSNEVRVQFESEPIVKGWYNYIYSQGSTFYETILANENELPEEGTLIEGSATGNYCIIQVGGLKYYYKRI